MFTNQIPVIQPEHPQGLIADAGWSDTEKIRI